MCLDLIQSKISGPYKSKALNFKFLSGSLEEASSFNSLVALVIETPAA